MIPGLIAKGILGKLIKGGFGFLKDFQKGKRSKEELLAQWETKAIRASQDSWKDEFWTLVIGLPFILREIGVLVEAFGGAPTLSVAAGVMIQDLNVMLGGQYYVVAITCISASFGVRLTDRIGSGKLMKAGMDFQKKEDKQTKRSRP